MAEFHGMKKKIIYIKYDSQPSYKKKYTVKMSLNTFTAAVTSFPHPGDPEL